MKVFFCGIVFAFAALVGCSDSGSNSGSSVPRLSSPAKNAANVSTRVDFEWSAVTSASSYELQIRDKLTTLAVLDSSGLELPSLIITLLGNTQYEWRAGSIDAMGSESWSEWFSFSTASGALNLIFANPDDAEITVGDTATFIAQVVDLSPVVSRVAFSFKWYRIQGTDTQIVADADSNALKIANAQVSQDGSRYFCIITAPGTTSLPDTTHAALLKVNPFLLAKASGTTANLYSIQFVTPDTGWVVGSSGTLLKTTDGGSTWALQTSGISTNLSSVSFSDTKNGWAAGGGVVIKTTNGGATWVVQSQSFSGLSISFPNPDDGFAAAGSSGLLTSDDSGKVWSNLGGSVRIQSLSSIICENTGCVYTSNGQCAFQRSFCDAVGVVHIYDSTCTLYDNQYLHQCVTWTHTNDRSTGGLFESTDGLNFNYTSVAGTQSFQSLAWAGPNPILWAIGKSGGSTVVYERFTNPILKFTTSATLNALGFTDKSNGVLVGGNGVVYRTTDEGKTWTTPSSGTSNRLNSVAVSHGNIWIVGDNGILLYHKN